MATVYAQNIIEVAIKATYAGRPHVNVLHLHNDEGAQSDQAKVNDLRTAWQQHILPMVSNQYVLEAYHWRSLDQDDANVGITAPDPEHAAAGGGSWQAMPPNVAYLIRKNTANRPRGRRDGRMFLCGMPETNVGPDGVVDAATVTNVNTGLQSFVDAVSDDQWGVGGGSGLAVLETTPASRTPGTQPVTVDWRAVTSMTVANLVASTGGRIR